MVGLNVGWIQTVMTSVPGVLPSHEFGTVQFLPAKDKKPSNIFLFLSRNIPQVKNLRYSFHKDFY